MYNGSMRLAWTHPWPTSIREARDLQEQLASQVSCRNEAPDEPRYVAGIDVSGKGADGRVRSAAVVLRWEDMAVVEVRTADTAPRFPYVPGLLAFREAPAVLDVLERLDTTPDLILADGQGLAHPRRFGLACHVGLLAGVPTIGCAKSLLVGRYSGLSPEHGASADLVHRDEVVGSAVRTRGGVSPVFVSVGHRVDLPAAVRLTLACCRGYRVPEPTRTAHHAAAGRLPETGRVAAQLAGTGRLNTPYST